MFGLHTPLSSIQGIDERQREGVFGFVRGLTSGQGRGGKETGKRDRSQMTESEIHPSLSANHLHIPNPYPFPTISGDRSPPLLSHRTRSRYGVHARIFRICVVNHCELARTEWFPWGLVNSRRRYRLGGEGCTRLVPVFISVVRKQGKFNQVST